ncbi:MAG: hypothetical protein GVY29_06385 [Spirochaetes bacterium]|jgi:cell division protein FtsN|nr:hypothetical protein [Spirochaetota bacterium]
MEQHRTLLIIVSVTLFAAIVIGVGLALLYPRAQEAADPSMAAGDRTPFDPIEYIRTPQEEEPEFEVPEKSKDDDLIIVYGDKSEEEEGDEDKGAVPETTKAPEDTAKPDTPEESAPKPETRKPATSLGPQRAPKEDEPAPAPEPEYRRVTEYWIQVISSPSRDRVEQAKERLEGQELGGRITSKLIDGQTYYRLRVGPYSNKNEAEKFLGWISDIEGFAESYISEEYPLKRVN